MKISISQGKNKSFKQLYSINMKKNPKYPFKHLSIRVPWHDNGWNGTICNNPLKNNACLVLKNTAQNRDDEKEAQHAGESLKSMDENDFPVCVTERATFMADFPFYKNLTHPYVNNSPSTHGHLKKTPVRFPAYSADAVPFNWMLKANMEEKSNLYNLDVDMEREPKLDWGDKSNDNWVQEYSNQKALLNCFFEHLKEEESLVFFYAKQVPFVEDNRRIIVGVGKITKIITSEKYEGSNEKFSAAYWQHMVLHSIRPDYKDGFILPYHEALDYQKDHPEFDPAELAVSAPNDKRMEFSYASEHVSNDTSIRVLMNCLHSIEKAQELGIGEKHEQIKNWIHDEVSRLQKLRGDYPGMGAALTVFGIPRGHFVASEIISHMNDKDNPWEIFHQALHNPQGILSPETSALIGNQNKKLYENYLKREDRTRIDLLHLLSRFDLSIEQAKLLYIEEEMEKNDIHINDEEILNNPYLIYELTRNTLEPVDISTIDFGLFNLKNQQGLLPKNSQLDDPLDSRRIRALTVKTLETALLQGHTLLPQKQIIAQIRNRPITPECPINKDYFTLVEDYFNGVIEIKKMGNKETAYQLKRLDEYGKIIQKKVTKRINAKRKQIDIDWRQQIDTTFDKQNNQHLYNEQEEKARSEKAAALKELAESRFSILTGPAGTGKTTLLTILASQPEIQDNGVLLLAPTGKARVRIQEMAKNVSITAYTIAQFLHQYKRFNGKLQQYKLSEERCKGDYKTVILDEASMLTENMLATLFDCLTGVERFILVGDHRQLPPIGGGRPFVDIINYLRTEELEKQFPVVTNGYAELTIRRRQIEEDRLDLRLAEWFSGAELEPAADSIFSDIIREDNKHIRVVHWANENDFEKKFEQTLMKELNLNSIDDEKNFNKQLGSPDGKYFNDTGKAKYFNNQRAVDFVENWQILSPVKEKTFGVRALNRKIHKSFKSYILEESKKGRTIYLSNGKEITVKNYPKPGGIEEIIYGDKVMNLYNHRRKDVYPKENSLQYIANGEIGIVTGQLKTKKSKYKGQPQFIKVEFTSQKGFTYTYKNNEFGEESDPPVELAYAIAGQ